MKRILRGVPRMRNAMLLGVAGLAARIPDDTPEVIQLGTNDQSCMPDLKMHQDLAVYVDVLEARISKKLSASSLEKETPKIVLMLNESSLKDQLVVLSTFKFNCKTAGRKRKSNLEADRTEGGLEQE